MPGSNTAGRSQRPAKSLSHGDPIPARRRIPHARKPTSPGGPPSWPATADPRCRRRPDRGHRPAHRPRRGGDEHLLEPDRQQRRYYYQMWTAGQGSACITLNSGTSYSTTWSGIGDFVAGVGWNPGNNQTRQLLRQPQRQRRHHAGLALRLVDQPAGRVLRRRGLRRFPEHRRHVHGPDDQRRRHVQHLRAPAGQPALHPGHRHLRAVPGDPHLADLQRHHHHSRTSSTPGPATA